jgi:hypothetical protein
LPEWCRHSPPYSWRSWGPTGSRRFTFTPYPSPC